MQQQNLCEEEEAMTYDEVSMQESKHFINALQELKNLRPQLYSAAEYCEMSYLHNEQKQTVLENLKDYAVKALVNAVDHLGTVAYKLDDLISQQTTELSTTELKIACLDQRLRTYQEYNDKEGVKQQSLVNSVPRYHKHYILPCPPSGRFYGSADKVSGIGQENAKAKPQPVPPGTNVNRSLSWYLAAEARTALYGNSNIPNSNEFYSMSSTAASETFFFPEAEVSIPSFSGPQSRAQSVPGTPGSTTPNSFGAGRRAPQENNKKLSKLMSLDDKGQAVIRRPPTRSKSMLSSLFSRHKSMKQKSTLAL